MKITHLKTGDRLIVRNGSRGTQVAVVANPTTDGGLTVRVHKWLARGRRWTDRVRIYPQDILAFATPEDFRKRRVSSLAPIGRK
jgi:hypothetical protein